MTTQVPEEQYEKLVVESSDDLLRGFVTGWAVGQGWSREEIGHRIVWPQEWDIHVGSTLEGIVDSLIHSRVSFVIVRTDTVESLVEVLQIWEARLPLHLRSRHRIHSASFDFRFKIYGRADAAGVRSIFETLPPGVQISDDYVPTEKSDPTARGPEMYAPLHSYVFRGSGTISGRLRGVLEVHERARQYERIRRKPVNLQLVS